MISKREEVFGVELTPTSAVVGLHGWFCSFLDDWLFHNFRLYHLPKTVEPLSAQRNYLLFI